VTIVPVRPAPDAVCPTCGQTLAHEYSHIGGVNARDTDQWDGLSRPTGCGMFQYRRRTNKVRPVASE